MHVFKGASKNGKPREKDREQPILIRRLEPMLHEGGDPDAGGMPQFASGVRLGVGTRMPRTLAVYPRKTRWRLESQAVEERGPREVEVVRGENYLTARTNADEIEKQVEEHV